jgi:hypothetical protein
MTARAARWVRAHRKLALIAIATIAVTILLVSYESWRVSVESQIISKVDSLNSSDTCEWVFSHEIVEEFQHKPIFYEGGDIHTTSLGGDWSSVVNAAFQVRSQILLSGRQPCILSFGLTRTFFILLTNQTEGLHFNSFFVDVFLVYARYAPL